MVTLFFPAGARGWMHAVLAWGPLALVLAGHVQKGRGMLGVTPEAWSRARACVHAASGPTSILIKEPGTS